MYLTISIKPVTEFVRHDAEIMLDVNGKRKQFVIRARCASNAEADEVGERFCNDLLQILSYHIDELTKNLKEAKP